MIPLAIDAWAGAARTPATSKTTAIRTPICFGFNMAPPLGLRAKGLRLARLVCRVVGVAAVFLA
jgi:hypothetical protein